MNVSLNLFEKSLQNQPSILHFTVTILPKWKTQSSSEKPEGDCVINIKKIICLAGKFYYYSCSHLLRVA